MAGSGKKQLQADRKVNRTTYNPQQKDKPASSSGSSDMTPPPITTYDGTKEPTEPYSPDFTVAHGRLEGLGSTGVNTGLGNLGTAGYLRPKQACTLGKEIILRLNVFDVQTFPTKPTYQYDFKVLEKDPEKIRLAIKHEKQTKEGWVLCENRAILRKIWQSATVQAKVGPSAVYDGLFNCWSLTQIPGNEAKIDLDLNVEQGRASSQRMANQFHVIIRFSRTVRFDILNAWLDNRASFDVQCLEAISLLDHLMRENPSRRFTPVRKSYFSRAPGTFTEIDTREGKAGIELAKGMFASIRAASGVNGSPPRLTLNVDVANVAFFAPGHMLSSILKFGKFREVPQFVAACRSLQNEIMKVNGKSEKDTKELRKEKYKDSNLYDNVLKKFTKCRIEYKHQTARPGQPKSQYTVEKIELDKTAASHSFDLKTTDANGNVTTRPITVAAYFKEKYKVIVDNYLPLVKTTKGDLVPMDQCDIPAGQRYPFRLSGTETDAMLRFAISLPAERWQSIENSYATLNWHADPILQNYGLKISREATKTKGRLLERPTIEFKPLNKWDPVVRQQVIRNAGSNQKAQPKQSIYGKPCDDGRWDLMGVQFMHENRAALLSWGFAIVDAGRGPCVSMQHITNFAKVFTQTYRAHGGLVQTHEPICFPVQTKLGGEMITAAWNTIGNKYKRKPQMIFFVVDQKIAELYKRIKKSCDCRYGVPSQVLQAAHVIKAQGQYCSNVALKVNAKLGGWTSRTKSTVLPKLNPAAPQKVTAIMGADVSHAAPGLVQASLAAMTLNMDQEFCRYLARCQTNGVRVEMIRTENIDSCLKPLFECFMTAHNGRVPDRLLYIRDGVSELQYPQVLKQEVRDIKALLQHINPGTKCDFTVVIAAKRHHIRFFPGPNGDRNQNPKPGTLVEQGCTHPFEFDWYMCSHSAIKGTARPIHYHVLLNENEAFKPLELQQMIFEHSYQSIRSTTPISQHPAVAYAHLASKRAECHLQGMPRTAGKKNDKKDGETTASGPPPEPLPLIVMPDENAAINETMWFV